MNARRLLNQISATLDEVFGLLMALGAACLASIVLGTIVNAAAAPPARPADPWVHGAMALSALLAVVGTGRAARRVTR